MGHKLDSRFHWSRTVKSSKYGSFTSASDHIDMNPSFIARRNFDISDKSVGFDGLKVIPYRFANLTAIWHYKSFTITRYSAVLEVLKIANPTWTYVGNEHNGLNFRITQVDLCNFNLWTVTLPCQSFAQGVYKCT